MNLNTYNDSYRDAIPPERINSDEVPNGEYQVKIEAADLKVFGGVDQLSFKLRVLEGDCLGRILWKNDRFSADPEKMKFVKADIELCGIQLESFDELESRLKGFSGLELIVNKTTNKAGYANVYFKELLGACGAGELVETDYVVEGETDNLPF